MSGFPKKASVAQAAYAREKRKEVIQLVDEEQQEFQENTPAQGMLGGAAKKWECCVCEAGTCTEGFGSGETQHQTLVCKHTIGDVGAWTGSL